MDSVNNILFLPKYVRKKKQYQVCKEEYIFFYTATSMRSNTEGIAYKKKLLETEIQISRGCKDKCHVYKPCKVK